MTETEIFEQIDEGIETFKKNEGFRKGIKVSKTQHSDWLIFNWRQLTWRNDGIEYLIEIYPEFDDNKNVSSWILYTAAYDDADKKRFHTKHTFAREKELTFIAEHIYQLLVDSFKFISNILKEDIPFAVDLK